MEKTLNTVGGLLLKTTDKVVTEDIIVKAKNSENIIPENIKKGVEILNVTGTHEGTSLPEGSAGTALVHNGTEWIAQEGYGYKESDEVKTTITWDGDITGKVSFEYFYKVQDEIPENLEQWNSGTISIQYYGTFKIVSSIDVSEEFGLPGVWGLVINYGGEEDICEFCLFLTEDVTIEEQTLPKGVYSFYQSDSETGGIKLFVSKIVGVVSSEYTTISPDILPDGVGYTKSEGGELTTLTWDGQITDESRAYCMMMSPRNFKNKIPNLPGINDTNSGIQYLYRISDDFTTSDILDGETMKFIYNGTEYTETMSIYAEMEQGFAVKVSKTIESSTVSLLIYSLNSHYGQLPVGTYFYLYNGTPRYYVSEIPFQIAESVHKIDSKYIPTPTKISIDDQEYQFKISTTDAGEEGYITFVTEE